MPLRGGINRAPIVTMLKVRKLAGIEFFSQRTGLLLVIVGSSDWKVLLGLMMLARLGHCHSV